MLLVSNMIINKYVIIAFVLFVSFCIVLLVTCCYSISLAFILAFSRLPDFSLLSLFLLSVIHFSVVLISVNGPSFLSVQKVVITLSFPIKSGMSHRNNKTIIQPRTTKTQTLTFSSLCFCNIIRVGLNF